MAIGSFAGPRDKPREELAAAPATGAAGPQAEFLEEIAYYEQLILITAHFGKHSGAVSLAYRRINGVVPPRNAEQQQQQKRAEKAKSWWFGAKFQALG